ncbi:hypothetical protein [Thiohalomonas denitrificans]|uniref:hypothetical protein n=1 Tax=Thiohalomonas denitrificans TaxID=415747 RepID=UPI0026EB1C01|nr:hypothetical protein [Thiohalomonas denitrificans]
MKPLPEEDNAPDVFPVRIGAKTLDEGIRRYVPEGGFDNSQIHALVAKGEFQVPERGINEGDTRREKNFSVGIDPTVDRWRYQCGPAGLYDRELKLGYQEGVADWFHLGAGFSKTIQMT